MRQPRPRRDASRLLEDLSAQHPRDLLALQAGHQVDFFTGDSRMLRDRVARVRPQWNEAMPGYHAVLGMHAFGLEETGDYGQAERTGRWAIELESRDNWAWQRWRMCTRCGICRKTASPGLSRMRRTVGDRWRPLAERWAPHASAGNYVFNDLHAMMAFASAGRSELAAQLRDTQRSALTGEGDNRAFTAEVGEPATLAVQAFVAGDYAAVVALIRPIRSIAHRFGGSHAQRDLLDLTLIEAALRGGDRPLAAALAAERAAMRPASPLARRFELRARA